MCAHECVRFSKDNLTVSTMIIVTPNMTSMHTVGIVRGWGGGVVGGLVGGGGGGLSGLTLVPS